MAKIPAKCKIGTVTVTIMIDEEEEQLFREAHRQLKLKYQSFCEIFSDAELPESELLAMLAIDIAYSHLKLEKNNDSVFFKDKLQLLDDELKDYLNEQ
jgi:FKBP-type peptidyl-prolyl cis-trans isomerase (trigger factor)